MSGFTHQMAPELFQCQAPEQNKIIVTDTAGSNAGAGQYKACGLGNYLILEDHIHHHKKKIQLTIVWFAPEAEMKSSSQHKIPWLVPPGQSRPLPLPHLINKLFAKNLNKGSTISHLPTRTSSVRPHSSMVPWPEYSQVHSSVGPTWSGTCNCL